jgi:hypothetical protein
VLVENVPDPTLTEPTDAVVMIARAGQVAAPHRPAPGILGSRCTVAVKRAGAAASVAGGGTSGPAGPVAGSAGSAAIAASSSSVTVPIGAVSSSIWSSSILASGRGGR